MTNLTNDDLARVTGGAEASKCTADNPTGGYQPPPPKQFIERDHSGPSTEQRVMDGTNTLTSRGMSMLNDGRPSMPAQW